jgi:hypothetical protein
MFGIQVAALIQSARELGYNRWTAAGQWQDNGWAPAPGWQDEAQTQQTPPSSRRRSRHGTPRYGAGIYI